MSIRLPGHELHRDSTIEAFPTLEIFGKPWLACYAGREPKNEG